MRFTMVSMVQKAVAEFKNFNSGCCTVFLCDASEENKKNTSQELKEIMQDLCDNSAVNVLVYAPGVQGASTKDCSVPLSQGLQQADVIIFLSKDATVRSVDKKMLQNKKVLDFCEQSYAFSGQLYWPASCILDFFIVNQDDIRHTQPPKNDREEKTQ